MGHRHQIEVEHGHVHALLRRIDRGDEPFVEPPGGTTRRPGCGVGEDDPLDRVAGRRDVLAGALGTMASFFRCPADDQQEETEQQPGPELPDPPLTFSAKEPFG